jgi:hypothetical protein
MKVRHRTLAIKAVAKGGIVVGLKIHTDVMPYQLGRIWIASVKRYLTPAQRTAAVVVNGQRRHDSNFT